MIPPKYTCDGYGINPPLVISNVPQGAISLALLVEDPDAPNGLWVHWMVWNIPPNDMIISESSISSAVVGKSSSGNKRWDSICPPDKEHRYFFKLYALDTEIFLDPENANKQELKRLIEGHLIEECELIGRYKRVTLV